MLFNSYIFILLFLPTTLFIFFSIGKIGHHRVAISWLVLSSLFFYGWWNPAYLYLLLFSMIFNYALGVVLSSKDKLLFKKALLLSGIGLNLALLGYFKYANFFVEQLNLAVGTSYNLEKIILPLAISFFTFQQISYLVDAYRHETKEYNFLHYCLFVTFFPQLIAGPIVHHKEMLPQFANNDIYKVNSKNLIIGLSIFTIGLFKKVIVADNLALFANPVFTNLDNGGVITFFSAWTGALAYSFQLYFDFSGYSDMAIGIAYMFGIKLPMNFYSPYKSSSIIEFWRRWHITLSRFLRDYLYITMGGSRKGAYRRYVNLFVTMLLGGIWHGAGWTFIIWGGLHGVYLIINHAWRNIRVNWFKWSPYVSSFEVVSSTIITFIVVTLAWVYFRAESLSDANTILSAMFGGNGISLPRSFSEYSEVLNFNNSISFFSFNGVYGQFIYQLETSLSWMFFAVILVFLAPNSIQILQYIENKPLSKSNPRAPYALTVIVAIIFAFILSNLMKVSDFLYFNF
jgi:alginate O-acetyltransferase complex protein AlgI